MKKLSLALAIAAVCSVGSQAVFADIISEYTFSAAPNTKKSTGTLASSPATDFVLGQSQTLASPAYAVRLTVDTTTLAGPPNFSVTLPSLYQLGAMTFDYRTSNGSSTTIGPVGDLNIEMNTGSGWSAILASTTISESQYGAGVWGAFTTPIDLSAYTLTGPVAFRFNWDKTNTSGSSYFDMDNIRVTAMPVPEASTYGMMLAGLGLVGAMARRRKQA